MLNVGRGFRAPQPIELFANGVHEGTIQYNVGNPDLKNETSINTDLAVRVQSGTGERRARRVRQLHQQLHLLPADRDVRLAVGRAGRSVLGSRQLLLLPEVPGGQGDARLTGFEFSAEYHPTPYLHLSGTADYTRGQNRSVDQPLPLVPPFRATYGARFEGKGNGTFLNPYVSVGGETNAQQTKLDPDDFAPAGYTLANAGAGVGLTAGARVVNIDVTLRNVFDKEYQNFLSRYKFATDPIVLDPGRNLTMRISTDF